MLLAELSSSGPISLAGDIARIDELASLGIDRLTVVGSSPGSDPTAIAEATEALEREVLPHV